MKNTNKKPSKAFTLIEAIVVLFIIGLLSVVAGIGYGTANRSKKVEQAARKINSELDATRNYAVFGQEIDEKFPCAYGIALNVGQDDELKNVYVNGSVSIDGENVELTREGAMEKDLTCDELIDSAQNSNQEINFSFNNYKDLSLDSVNIDTINHNTDATSLQCAVVLFSAPRGAAYYFSDSAANCSAGTGSTGKFTLFSENTIDPEPKDTNYFITKIKISEGFLSSEACHKTYPSGNGEILSDCPTGE